jgi:hypothetical protein
VLTPIESKLNISMNLSDAVSTEVVRHIESRVRRKLKCKDIERKKWYT